jgi:hypothetical protein
MINLKEFNLNELKSRDLEKLHGGGLLVMVWQQEIPFLLQA